MPRKKLSETQITGALAERITSDGTRHITLNRDERRALERQQLAEAAAALFLDLETDRSYRQIAEELGISLPRLKELTKWPEFDAAYNQLFAELGHDPRFKAAQGAISDMLPLAVRELKRLITAADTPAGVKHKAIQDILKLNGLVQPQAQGNDRRELAEYLKAQNINITQVNIAVPPEYTSEFASLIEGEILGEVVEHEDEGESPSELQESFEGDGSPGSVDPLE